MAHYEYTALNPGGARVQGSIAGPSEQAVLSELERRRLTPVSITETRERARGGGISARKLGETYVQMSDLLRAGVPLLRTLRLLGNRRGSPALAAMARDLADQVEKGSDLASALGAKPGVFPPVHVAMVRAGERGGFLEDVLGRLGLLLIKQADMRARVIGNLIYPLILVVLGAGSLVAIFGFMIPRYRPMFEKIKGGLPPMTKMVFAISDALTTHGLTTFLVLAGLGVGSWMALRRPEVREAVERWKTRLPVLGPVVRGYATARFCQLLGTMLGNSVPLLAALQIARDGAGNLLMERAIDAASEEVRAGRALAPPLGESGLFDDDVVEMIAVGEAANNLDAVLVKAGESLEGRLDRMIGVAIRLVEPLLLLVIAVVIGIVAMALLIPMSRLGSSL